MTIFRITPSSYFGDAATLATADRDGLRLFVSALQSAQITGVACFDSEGVQHRIEQQSGAAVLEAARDSVVWRLDIEKIEEIIDLAESLIVRGAGGHQYVDIDSPTSTLVISVDEPG
ncbi:hypothetical protein FR943_19685 [Mycobacterium sp. TNTM28]|uniref:Uncharacterized protein n=1 Tax=[Mycobacterium] fortunisiensis TaxID=2600579 RepID=A0ABS6KRE3_9MYCO|nr:hypothetical protein [[Mycobacterium] fortunisiensis]MBU9766054.1 hypothetical protein [[Mycobacterium] fortunisiensis]